MVGVLALAGCGTTATATARSSEPRDSATSARRRRRRPQGRSRLRRGRSRRPVLQRLGLRRPREGRRATSTPPAPRPRPPTARTTPHREDRLRKLADAGLQPDRRASASSTRPAAAKVAPEYPDINFAVIDGYDPDGDASRQRRLPGLRRGAGLLPRRRRGCAQDQGQARRLRRWRPRRPDQEVRGRLHRRRARRSTRRSRSTSSTSPRTRATSPASRTRPVARPPPRAMFDKGADMVYHAAGKSGSVSSRPPPRPATASGPSVSTPTSTSPPPRTSSRTSSPRCSSASTWRSFDYDQGGRRRRSPQRATSTYDLAADGVGYSTSGGFVDDIKDQIDGYAEQIKSGEIKVPTAP